MKPNYNCLRQALVAVALLTATGFAAVRGGSPALPPRLNATNQNNASDSAIYIAYVKADNTTESIDCDANNQFTVNLRVVIENDGNATLQPGDANYSLSIVDHYNNDSVLLTQAVDQTLAPNQQSDTIRLSVKLDYADFIEGTKFYVRENLSRTSKYGVYIKPVPYRPIAVYTVDKLTLQDGATLDFGTTAKPTARTITLENQGAAPLTVNSITTPDGFHTTTEAQPLPYSLGAHQKTSFKVSFMASEPKTYSDSLIFQTDAGRFALCLKATDLDSTLYYVDFETGKIPPNFIQTANGWSISTAPGDMGLRGNYYCADEYSSADTLRLITPLIHFDEGQALQFQVAKKGSKSYLNVYTSPDRQNWTLLRQLSAQAEDAADRFSNDQVQGGWDSYYAFTDFSLSPMPAGDRYIAFEAGGVYLDNIYGGEAVEVDHDMLPEATDIPAEAMVNYAQRASVTFHNASLNEESDCQAVFHLGNEAKAIGKVDIASGESKSIDFTFTPHEAGTLKAFVTLQGVGFAVSSDTVSVNVAAETESSFAQAGEVASASSYSLMSASYKKNHSEQVYSPNDIQLPAGTAIKALRFKGCLSGSDLTSNIRIYMANVADSLPGEEPRDTTQMTKVYENPAYTIRQGGEGSYKGITVPANLIDVAFVQPFVYDGTNLCIVVVSDNSFDGYPMGYWQTSYKKSSIIASGSSYWSTEFYDEKQPVAYLGYDKAATTATGSVADTDGLPIEGADVRAVSGDVVYHSTTDAEGKYSMRIMQDHAVYRVRYNKPGYIPHEEEHDFSTGSWQKDVVLQRANGFMVERTSIPTTGAVNSRYTATATVFNPEASGIAAEDYTVSLVFDQEVVAQAVPTAVASNGEASFTLGLTPHASGTHKACIVWTMAGKTVTTDTVEVNIKEESFTKTVQAGDSTDIRNYDTPVNLSYRNSETALVYPASTLNLQKGSVINRIRFRGYVENGEDTLKASIRAYIANTDMTTFDRSSYTYAASGVDTTEMARICDSVFTFTTVGSKAQPEVVLDLEIPGGFVYTGQNLMLYLCKSADYYTNCYFVTDRTQGHTVLSRSNDDNLNDKFYSMDRLPVVWLDVTRSATATFQVADEDGTPIDGARVTLRSDDVEYYGQALGQGQYEVTVGRIANVYAALVEAEGYEDTTVVGVNFAESLSPIYQIVMKRRIADAIASPSASQRISREWYVDLSGRRTQSPGRGAYIKVTVFADGSKTLRKVIRR